MMSKLLDTATVVNVRVIFFKKDLYKSDFFLNLIKKPIRVGQILSHVSRLIAFVWYNMHEYKRE